MNRLPPAHLTGLLVSAVLHGTAAALLIGGLDLIRTPPPPAPIEVSLVSVPAPVAADLPTFFPVRTVAAFLWAAADPSAFRA